MSILCQSTISKKVNVKGVGLHTGKIADLKIFPSEPNTGIVFKRVDLDQKKILYYLYFIMLLQLIYVLRLVMNIQ